MEDIEVEEAVGGGRSGGYTVRIPRRLYGEFVAVKWEVYGVWLRQGEILKLIVTSFHSYNNSFASTAASTYTVQVAEYRKNDLLQGGQLGGRAGGRSDKVNKYFLMTCPKRR